MKFWGYLHENGTHHVRSYVEPYSAASVDDAVESPFAVIVIQPFTAHDIVDARSMLKKLVEEARGE